MRERKKRHSHGGDTDKRWQSEKDRGRGEKRREQEIEKQGQTVAETRATECDRHNERSRREKEERLGPAVRREEA